MPGTNLWSSQSDKAGKANGTPEYFAAILQGEIFCRQISSYYLTPLKMGANSFL